MPIVIEQPTTDKAWFTLLSFLDSDGKRVEPRGKGCLEITDTTVRIKDARANIIVNPYRNLSYRFMVAECFWIWFGHDDVPTIARYNKHIAQFSDDGETFNGTYGVPIVSQWAHVRDTLIEDPMSRQAVISIYGQHRARRSKDIPCTISLQFLIRDNQLNITATMRSSDVWLGLPYDVFNFTMLGNIMASQVNVPLGSITLNLGSSHLYETNSEEAARVLLHPNENRGLRSPQLPSAPPEELDDVLEAGSEVKLLPHPWSVYARVLSAATNRDALGVLTEAFDAQA